MDAPRGDSDPAVEPDDPSNAATTVADDGGVERGEPLSWRAGSELRGFAAVLCRLCRIGLSLHRAVIRRRWAGIGRIVRLEAH